MGLGKTFRHLGVLMILSILFGMSIIAVTWWSIEDMLTCKNNDIYRETLVLLMIGIILLVSGASYFICRGRTNVMSPHIMVKAEIAIIISLILSIASLVLTLKMQSKIKNSPSCKISKSLSWLKIISGVSTGGASLALVLWMIQKYQDKDSIEVKRVLKEEKAAERAERLAALKARSQHAKRRSRAAESGESVEGDGDEGDEGDEGR